MNKQGKSSNKPKSPYALQEEEILKFWAKDKTFAKSLKNRQGAPEFTFYDGPPYANGLPHHGHAVQSIIKDAMTRYKTMRGYYVPRRTGWDTHGLPIEYIIEQKLGFKGKADIVKYGVDKFNQACRESVFKYVKEWNRFFDRVGRWADKDDSYATMDSDYIESVWWAFAQIYKKKYVYEDFRSTPYCPRCATPLSNFEVNQGYRDGVKDPSLFVKFDLKDDPRKLLAWTTTPWSLPGNAAIAVNPSELYVTVKIKNDEGKSEKLILAEKCLHVLDQEYKVEAEQSGLELVGLSYKPLFKLDDKVFPLSSPNLFKIWSADFVSVEEGSGVLHVAPAFGEDDLSLSKDKDIPVLSTVDSNGLLNKNIGFKDVEGMFFKDADKSIIDFLSRQGRVFSAETFEHTYPFCWRCESPLLYYATTSWFISVSKIRDELVKNNKQINWVPKHIRDGRFGKWLEDARDWAFSRSRFWGAPLPIWRSDDGEVVVVESIDELKSLAQNPEVIDDLHRPYIDDVIITTKTGKTAHRVPEVFDVWFESGSMPYGQDHYPFENRKKVEDHFPADFIAEAMDQTRGWFYSLHVIATILFDKPAFKNVITTGWVNAADGEKLSKRKKNYTPLDDLFDQHGADAIRYFMLTSPIVHGEDIRFSSDSLTDVERNVLGTLSNTYNFFSMYQAIDGWKPKDSLKPPSTGSALDKWMISRLNQTIIEVTKYADSYELDRATRPIRDLLDDISNWYVRRSRRRFWKSEDDNDKHTAYQTLHYVLVTTTQLMAPWMPFISERYYQKLTAGMKMMPKSVHLTNWPKAKSGDVDQQSLSAMRELRQLIVEGLAQRAKEQIKVRQPLAKVSVVATTTLTDELQQIMCEELNVKSIDVATGNQNRVVLDTKITTDLMREGIIRDLVRRVQNLRKKSGLKVDDRINLMIKSDDKDVRAAIKKFSEVIKNETLAKSLSGSGELEHTQTVTIAEADIELGLEKAK